MTQAQPFPEKKAQPTSDVRVEADGQGRARIGNARRGGWVSAYTLALGELSDLIEEAKHRSRPRLVIVGTLAGVILGSAGRDH
jgi:hypothetical protein